MDDSGLSLRTLRSKESRDNIKIRQKRCQSAFPAYKPDMGALHQASLYRLSCSANPIKSKRTLTGSRVTRTPRATKPRLSVSAFTFPDHSKTSPCRPRVQRIESDSYYADIDKYLNDSVFEDQEEEMPVKPPEPDDTSQKVYKNVCRKLHVTMARTFFQGLLQKKIVMRNHILGPDGAEACATALAMNSCVEVLDLHGNEIGVEGTHIFAKLLKDNIFLTELGLSRNRLKTEGARAICNALTLNETVVKLDLSGNEFKENDAAFFADLIEDNTTITDLILSHNEFREKGGVTLGKAIVNTQTLRLLDLSWNHLRRQGAISICDGIQKNTSIVDLNVAWNGFHLEGSKALAKALKVNTTLVTLNISSNRINLECVVELIKGLKHNATLGVLRIADNPLTSEGAIRLLKLVETVDTIGLKEIDISGQCVDSQFLSRLQELQSLKHMEFHHGRLLKQDGRMTTSGAGDDFLQENPMTVLMEYMRLQNLRLVDLFVSLDRDGSQTLTREEFKEGLMKSNIPLSSRALDQLITHLDTDGDGEVDYSELIAGQKAHKKRMLKSLRENRNTPFCETEIGRVSSKLQALMSLKKLWRLKAMKLSDDTAKKITESLEDVVKSVYGTHVATTETFMDSKGTVLIRDNKRLAGKGAVRSTGNFVTYDDYMSI